MGFDRLYKFVRWINRREDACQDREDHQAAAARERMIMYSSRSISSMQFFLWS